MKEEARNSGISGAQDNGHEFSTQKNWIVYNQLVDETNLVFGFMPYRYRGPMVIRYPDYGSSSFSGFYPIPTFESGYYGTKAIQLTAPTAPDSSTLVSLAELYREGLPHLLGVQAGRSMRGSLKDPLRQQYPSRRKQNRDRYRNRTTKTDQVVKGGNSSAKSASNDYLGYQFGWKPLVSAIVESALAVDRADQIMRQYNRDSGRNVRRKYSFPLESSTTLETVGGSIGPFTNTTGVQPWKGTTQTFVSGPIQKLTHTLRVIKFSGAYTYHSPYTDNQVWENLQGYHALAKKVLGLELTPEVVWNLIPWSWLADWQVNIGSIMSNMSYLSTDNLVLRYGYLTCHTITRVDYVMYGPETNSGVKGPWVNSYYSEKKERIRASPYGFGRTPGSFSDRQWSILTALGMSNGGNKLLS
jgi:hypothetical protein